MSRWSKLAGLVIAAFAAIATAGAADKEDGFFIFLDAAFATPQNTDEVLAVTQDIGPTQTQSTIRTDFGSDFAGRLGFGYQWKGGQSLSFQYWKFDADERTQADGPVNGFMNFAIGPPTLTSYGYYAQYGIPGSLDISSTVKAETFDVIWSREHDLTDNLSLKWSLGLRYAKFEENLNGTYDFYDVASGYAGYFTYGVDKHNEGTMYGVDAGLRVTRDFGKSFSVTSGLGFSFLQGEVESTSGLSMPPGSFGDLVGLAPTLASSSDSGRSGLIRDFDVGCYWRLAKDHVRIGIAWEQSSWDGVPYDLLRNTVGSLVQVEARNNVTFSSWKVGFKYQF